VSSMLVSLGPRAGAEDLVGLLLECHHRIRTFVGLAVQVATRDGLPAAEVVDACGRFERYFVEALPLHVEDEERSLLPRLAGLDGEVDSALATMRAQHAGHALLLKELLDAGRELRRSPGDAAARGRLGAAASRLSADFEQHLALEERVLFPAARGRLAADVQAQIVAELRERRRPRAG